MRIKNEYITSSKIYQMLIKLINEKNFSLEELSTALGLTISELEEVLTKKSARKRLAGKLTLPLISLYCRTTF